MTLPLVSVIIPTYERPEYLVEAIDSALGQTYSNIEVLVSDDGGDSDLTSIRQSYTDPRLRWRRNVSNVGMIRNVLNAIAATSGPFFAILADDDTWDPRFLQALVPELVQRPAVTCAFTDHWIMDAAGVIDVAESEANSRRWRRADLRPGTHEPFYDLALVDKCVPMVMGTVMRRSSIKWVDYPLEVATAYDRWLIYLASRTGGGAYYHPERLTAYRVHTGSETAKRSVAWIYGNLLCYERFWVDDALKTIRQRLRPQVANCRCGYGMALLGLERRPEARRYFVSSLVAKPSLRAAVGYLATVVPVSWSRRGVEALRRVKHQVRRRLYARLGLDLGYRG